MIEIVTLGTGAAIPGLFRNHSSTAIIHDGDIALFDCGEATQHQIQKSRLRHSKIKAVFISHVHGDHIFGLMGLLTTMSLNGRTTPLRIFGPAGIDEYLDFNLRFSNADLQYPLEVTEIEKNGVYAFNDISTVTAVELRHTVRTYGFKFIENDRPGRFDAKKAAECGLPAGPLYGRLQHGETIEFQGRTFVPADFLGETKKGAVISYSLDTEPCKGSHALAEGADVLIHDATYKDDEKGYAKRGRHSTHEDAFKTAQKHGVRTLIMTHFSQRYLELFKDEERDGIRIIYAYDGMRLEV